jgi:plastocyanin
LEELKMNKKILLVLSLVLVGLFVIGCTEKTNQRILPVDSGSQVVPEPMDDTVPQANEQTDTEVPTGNTVMEPTTSEGNVKTFVLTGDNFDFMMDGKDAPTLKVNEGDTVRIEFKSVEGFHDFVVDEFKAATGRVRDGGTTTVEFVADKKGTFEYYCSVGSHRSSGMEGPFIVE